MSLMGIISIVGASLKFAVPCFMIWIILRSVKFYYSGMEHEMKQEVLLGVFVFYILSLFGVTVYRYGIDWSGLGDWGNRWRQINGIPLKEIVKMASGGIGWPEIYNVVGNMAWFIPLGFLTPFVLKGKKQIGYVICISLAVSTSIELMQLLFRTGITDVDDLLFNVAGGIIGYSLYQIGKNYKKRA